MIIVSQNKVAHHSRLGNSLVLLQRLGVFKEHYKLDIYFPIAEEYRSYLRPDSYWLSKDIKKEASKVFKSHTGIDLSYEKLYEFIHTNNNESIKFLESVKVVIINNKNYNLKYDTDNLLEIIRSEYLVIFHEPFPFDTKMNSIVSNFSDNQIMPNEELLKKQADFFKLSHDKNKIGFHIRRGDYKQWSNGKYFYDDLYWINLYKKCINDNPFSFFYIFSNEEINFFLEYSNVVISNGNFEEDFCRLFYMDEIYGPPSTFTNMAHCLGNKYFQKASKLHFLPEISSCAD